MNIKDQVWYNVSRKILLYVINPAYNDLGRQIPIKVRIDGFKLDITHIQLRQQIASNIRRNIS
jgi:hypothetical protein